MALLSDLPNSRDVTPNSWSRIVGTADLTASRGNVRGGFSFCRVHHWDEGPGGGEIKDKKLVNFNPHTGQQLVLVRGGLVQHV